MLEPSKPSRRGRLAATAIAVMAAATTAGCASLSAEQATGTAQQWARQTLGAAPSLQTDDRDRTAAVRRALQEPLDADAASRVALINSAALQALMAESWAAQSRTQQAGRPLNPRFHFERLVRGDEVDIGRTLSLGLLDLLLWPLRSNASQRNIEAQQLQLASDVMRSLHDTRGRWVRAVAAGQRLRYQQQVLDAAQASAELARRMEGTGNFSRLQRAREQAFEIEARGQLARAETQAVAEREVLVRALGLNTAQGAQMKLPERLPDLPATARSADTVQRDAQNQRLDVQLAEARWAAAGGDEHVARTGSWADIEIGAQRNTNSNSGAPAQRGIELGLSLPLFDGGASQRQAANATQEAARRRLQQVQLDAASLLREHYRNYRSAYELARTQRDEVLPLRQTLLDETLLRYNGMLLSVFDLLAEARAQIGAVTAALDAQRDFWLADATLQAAVIGVPARSADLSAQADTAAATPLSPGH